MKSSRKIRIGMQFVGMDPWLEDGEAHAVQIDSCLFELSDGYLESIDFGFWPSPKVRIALRFERGLLILSFEGMLEIHISPIQVPTPIDVESRSQVKVGYFPRRHDVLGQDEVQIVTNSMILDFTAECLRASFSEG